MFRLDRVTQVITTKPASFNEQINLFGFIDDQECS